MNTLQERFRSKAQRFSRVAVSAASLLCVLTFASGARAADVSVHAGALCRAQNGADMTKIKADPTFITNTSTAAVTVICPLVRESEFSATGLGTSYVEVVGAAAGTMSCTMFSVEWTGVVLGSVTGTNNMSASFITLTGPGTSTAYSHYALQCTMPANSKIVNVWVTEN